MPANSDEYMLWCCCSDNVNRCFPVTTPRQATVSEFKKTIKLERDPEFNDVVYDGLTLFRVFFPSKERESRAMQIRYPESMEGSEELKEPTEPLSEVFDEAQIQPGYVNIIVVQELPSSKPRLRDDETKHCNDIKQLHQCITDRTPPDPNEFTNPLSLIDLPFPSLNDMPLRFAEVESGLFKFMGREMFAEVWRNWLEIKQDSRYRAAISIYGSVGYGKSHILAAFVCLLTRSGERVIYIPDCGEACKRPVRYLQTAFLFAFTDSPLDANRIDDWEKPEDIVKFCDGLRYRGVRLCFVIDQRNALDPMQPGTDYDNELRKSFHLLLLSITFDHKEISASANVKSYQYLRRKQTNDLKILMPGGMTEIEMKIWWQHHDNGFTDEDRSRIEDLTGRIPLFLAPFQQQKGPLSSLEPDIWRQETFLSVHEEVHRFARKQLVKSPAERMLFIRIMRDCLGNRATTEMEDMLDHRWFYVHEGRGHCALGLARESMLVWLRYCSQQDAFLSQEWLQTLAENRGKPPVVDSIVEQIVISKISSNGLSLGNAASNFDLPPAEVVVFDQRYPIISNQDGSTYYVPATFYYRDIDMLYVGIKNSVATIVVFRIAIACDHENSNDRLLCDWPQWTNLLQYCDIKLSFVWITKNTSKPSQRIQSHEQTPAYGLYWIPVEHVDKQFAETLSWMHPRYGVIKQDKPIRVKDASTGGPVSPQHIQRPGDNHRRDDDCSDGTKEREVPQASLPLLEQAHVPGVPASERSR